MDEEKVLNLRQRHFAVVRKSDRKSILRTGYIGTCVAFYGINRSKGVAFMAHIDGQIRGLEALIVELTSAADGDLEGFEIAMASNMKYWPRVSAVIVGIVVTCYPFWGGPIWLLCIVFFVAAAFWLYFCFGSLFLTYRFSRRWFTTTPIEWKAMDKCFRCVEVEVNSASNDKLAEPAPDRMTAKKSKETYGPPEEHWWHSKMKSQDSWTGVDGS